MNKTVVIMYNHATASLATSGLAKLSKYGVPGKKSWVCLAHPKSVRKTQHPGEGFTVVDLGEGIKGLKMTYEKFVAATSMEPVTGGYYLKDITQGRYTPPKIGFR